MALPWARTRKNADPRLREFDASWYAEHYPDVAEATRRGSFAAASEHFLAFGHAEGRFKNADEHQRFGAGRRSERFHGERRHLTPHDLRVSASTRKRVAVIGVCRSDIWTTAVDANADFDVDLYVSNGLGPLPERPLHPPEAYAFLFVQIGLRTVLSDSRLWDLSHEDRAGHEAVFDAVCATIDHCVGHLLAWNAAFGLPVFAANFVVPQNDLTGRLLPRYDLRNIAFFVSELNRHLERSIRGYKHAYIVDLDNICASFGRRYVQDDALLFNSHNGLLPPSLPPEARIEPTAALAESYEITWPSYLQDALWSELDAMYRTVRQVDAVKLVVVDLDDTLWRGVSGEDATPGPEIIEGWPLGIVEALAYLKKRGVLLGIISKNDEARVRAFWDATFGGHQFGLDEFAVIKINWNRKSQNMRAILDAVNLLARNTVFIDDNPVERAEIQNAFPDMRVLGRDLHSIRRILLWSAETQVASISSELARRTEMVQSQVSREATRATLGRDDFLASLALKVTLFELDTIAPRFTRAFELLNKTNQFNTTGRRWTFEEIERAARAGARFFAFEVEDRFTAYGLVGLCLVEGRRILQFVMSCRVNGMDVELAAMSEILERIGDGRSEDVEALLVETTANLLCRDLWRRCGFVETDGVWTRSAAPPLECPAAIDLRREGRSANASD